MSALSARACPRRSLWFPLIRQLRRVPANTDRYPLDRGLHMLGRHFRLAYTARHGEQLLQHLDEYIGLTEAAAPVRKRPYQLAQPARLFRRTGETEWERALWAEYGVSAKPQRSLVPEICGPVLTYQTMLRNTQQGRRLGRGGLAGTPPDHADARRRGTQRRARKRHAVARDRRGRGLRAGAPEGMATPASCRLGAGALEVARSGDG